MTDITGLNKDITNNLLIQFEVDIKDKIISPLPYLYISLRIYWTTPNKFWMFGGSGGLTSLFSSWIRASETKQVE